MKLSLGTAELLQLCHSNHPRRLVVAEARSLALVEYLVRWLCSALSVLVSLSRVRGFPSDHC